MPASSRPISRKRLYAGGIGSLVLVGVALRLFRLGHLSLWLDESFTALVSSGSVAEMLRFTVHDAGPLPLSYFFPWVARVLSGSTTEFTLRFFDFLFGSASLLLFYLLAKRLSSSEFVAVLGLVLLVFSSTHHYYSQEARGYAGLLFFTLLAFYFLWAAMEKNQPLLWLGYFLSLTIAFYFSLFATFVIAGNLLWGIGFILMGTHARKELIQRLVLLCSATLLLLIPVGLWFLFALPKYEATAVARFSWFKTAAFFSEAFVQLTGGIAYFSGPFLIVVIVGALLVQGRRRWLVLYPVLLFLVTFVTVCLNPTPPRLLHYRYLIVALPFWLLSFALVVETLMQRLKSRAARWGVVLVLLLGYLVVNGKGIANNYQQEKQNWRAAVRVVVQHYRSGDVILGGRNACFVPLLYYLPAELRPQLLRLSPTAPNMLKLMREGHRVWFVTAYYRWFYRWQAVGAEDSQRRAFYDWLDRYFERIRSFEGRDEVMVFHSKSLQPLPGPE